MGFDIAITTKDYAGNEDRTWLKTRKGFDTCRSVTLDVSTFLAAHISAKGAIPSGTILGKITATGKYGPYDDAASDGRQTAAGFLFNTTEVGGRGPYGSGSDAVLASAADVGAPMLWEGVIDESRLPAFAGTVLGEIDANARTDLKFVRFE